MNTQSQHDNDSNIPISTSVPPLKIGIEAQHLFKAHKQETDLVTLELIRHLQKVDHYNQYFIFVKPEVEIDCLQPSVNFEIVPVKGQTSVAWGQVYLPQVVKSKAIDLIHFTSNTASLQCEIPMIITLHNIAFLEGVPPGNSHYQKLNWAYRRWMIPEAVPKCAKVITSSRYEKENISQKLSIHSDNIEVVPCGVSHEYSIIHPQNYCKLHPQLYPKGFLLYLGNQAPKANARNLLMGYAAYVRGTVQPLPLAITNTSALQLNNLLAVPDFGWLKKHIVLTGNIPRNEMVQWFNQAQALLFTSLHKSIGLPVLEAMACGTLVIASDSLSMSEITDNCSLLVNPHQPSAIARAISQVHKNVQLTNSLVQQGFQQATKHRWKYQAHKVLNIYKQVSKLTLVR